MPSITQAYNWAINTCNADNVGYSQSYRNEQTVDGITYYDCSSFIWFALMNGGFEVISANGGSSWAFTTSTMRAILLKLGFKKLDITSEWKPGDIVWREGHCEMVYSGRTTMGAHSSSYELDRQVSINNYESSTSSWEELYRYGSASNSEPIITPIPPNYISHKFPVWLMCKKRR